MEVSGPLLRVRVLVALVPCIPDVSTPNLTSIWANPAHSVRQYRTSPSKGIAAYGLAYTSTGHCTVIAYQHSLQSTGHCIAGS
eukprot:2188091-Rhodomonas_salina.1